MNTSKKTERADLQNKRPIFFEIGLAVSLLIAYFAFESSSPVEKAESLGSAVIETEDWYDIAITRPEDAPLPPPPPPAKVMSDILEVVPDDEVVETDFASLEATEDTKVEIVEMAEPTEVEPEVEEPKVVFFAEHMPEYPGGDLALRKDLALNVKYPELAKDNEIQGTVYIRFVVDLDGSVTDVEVLRGVDPLLDKEAVRVVKALKKFKPGMQNFKPVRVSQQVPIKFQLQH